LCVWMLHWLISKRTKGLIGEENRNLFTHFRLLVLFLLLIFFDLAAVLVYTRKFIELDTKMSDIYVIAGIEVSLTCSFLMYLVLKVIFEGSRRQLQVLNSIDRTLL
jgi:ABC-type sulfate transport system permease component